MRVFPLEAVQTNIAGPENIVRAIREHRLQVDTVVGVTTDKACKPVNVMGMTKAIQERVFTSANLTCPDADILPTVGGALAVLLVMMILLAIVLELVERHHHGDHDRPPEPWP